MQRRQHLLMWLSGVMMIGCGWAAESTEFRVYYYHDMPPYVIPQAPESSLYQRYINGLQAGLPELSIQLIYLPRNRLDWMINTTGLDGAVLGVNPLWMHDREETIYQWTSPMAIDRDVVIFPSEAECTFRGPESLYGKTLTFVDGYYLFGISEAIDRGDIDFTGTSSQFAVTQMVASDRADAGVLSETSLNYFRNMSKLKKDLCVANTPQDEFTRHLMISRQLPVEMIADVVRVHDAWVNSEDWHVHLQRLHMTPLP